MSQQSLGGNNYYAAVKLPPGERKEEWISSMLIESLESLHALSEFVTEPIMAHAGRMRAGARIYLYSEDTTDLTEGEELTPDDYIARTFDYCEHMLNDPSLFPNERNGRYSSRAFKKTTKDLATRLARVHCFFVRELYRHFEAAGAIAHMNMTFKKFVCFGFEYKLVSRSEWAPVKSYLVAGLNKFERRMQSVEDVE